jgi:hypothetical protein
MTCLRAFQRYGTITISGKMALLPLALLFLLRFVRSWSSDFSQHVWYDTFCSGRLELADGKDCTW